MPAVCSHCGEYKLCRKQSMEPFGTGEHMEWNGLRLESYNWVCRECDHANAIIRENQKKAESIWKKNQQANWIKERDKILKQNDK